jgi:hypothetical protein
MVMAARLKVFVSTDGLTDYVVATTSRPKALAAWGVKQDLFKEGGARETDDAALRAEALAQPGEVLRRPAGTLAVLAKIQPRKLEPAKLKPAKPAKLKAPSKAALKKVESLQARLLKLDSEAAAIEARRSEAVEAAEIRARTEREALADKRRALKANLNQARRAAGLKAAAPG